MASGVTRDECLFEAVSEAARSGEPCPTNYVLADMLGLDSPSTASDMLRRLERNGLVEVARRNTSRIVTITETGEQTAEPKPKTRKYHKAEPRVANHPEPVTRDPCARCGVRADLHDQWGCGK